MTDDERMGRAVRVELARAGISAREMSRRLGWTTPYLATRLGGHVSFRVSDLAAIAAELSIPVQRFYDEVERATAASEDAAVTADAG